MLLEGVWGVGWAKNARALHQAYPLQPWRGAPECDYVPTATDDALGAHGRGAVHGSDCKAHSAQQKKSLLSDHSHTAIPRQEL